MSTKQPHVIPLQECWQHMQESSNAAAAQDTHGPQLLKIIACMAARFPAAEARQLAKGMLKVCMLSDTALGSVSTMCCTNTDASCGGVNPALALAGCCMYA